ncbi:hypothetical protein [Legionella busanensis]|nr:hypothetical protein [Legionella busanensis]
MIKNPRFIDERPAVINNRDQFAKIMDKFNNRPRKTLGYTTPNERFAAGI